MIRKSRSFLPSPGLFRSPFSLCLFIHPNLALLAAILLLCFAQLPKHSVSPNNFHSISYRFPTLSSLRSSISLLPSQSAPLSNFTFVSEFFHLAVALSRPRGRARKIDIAAGKEKDLLPSTRTRFYYLYDTGVRGSLCLNLKINRIISSLNRWFYKGNDSRNRAITNPISSRNCGVGNRLWILWRLSIFANLCLAPTTTILMMHAVGFLILRLRLC